MRETLRSTLAVDRDKTRVPRHISHSRPFDLVEACSAFELLIIESLFHFKKKIITSRYSQFSLIFHHQRILNFEFISAKVSKDKNFSKINLCCSVCRNHQFTLDRTVCLARWCKVLIVYRLTSKKSVQLNHQKCKDEK